MAQGEGKVDSAAPEFEDDRLHADLARANLFRLRGEYGEAERLCVDVLRRHPDSAAAHVLLGDIAIAQRKPEEAVRHFEMAQDLDPSSPDVTRKLDVARVQAQQQETIAAEEQLGLPPRSRLPWPAFAFGVLAVISLVAAIIAGSNARSTASAPRVGAPIMATPDTVSRTETTTSNSATSTPEATTPPAKAPETKPETKEESKVASVPMTLDDHSIFQVVQQRSQYGARLSSVSLDPRTHLATLTYQVQAQEDPRHIGADLAKTTLDNSGDTLNVTLRAVREERLVYMADVPRTRYADTLLETWQRDHASPESWEAYVVTNEWPYRSQDAQ